MPISAVVESKTNKPRPNPFGSTARIVSQPNAGGIGVIGQRPAIAQTKDVRTLTGRDFPGGEWFTPNRPLPEIGAGGQRHGASVRISRFRLLVSGNGHPPFLGLRVPENVRVAPVEEWFVSPNGGDVALEQQQRWSWLFGPPDQIPAGGDVRRNHKLLPGVRLEQEIRKRCVRRPVAVDARWDMLTAPSGPNSMPKASWVQEPARRFAGNPAAATKAMAATSCARGRLIGQRPSAQKRPVTLTLNALPESISTKGRPRSDECRRSDRKRCKG